MCFVKKNNCTCAYNFEKYLTEVHYEKGIRTCTYEFESTID